jgi:hypothetical protein
MGIFLLRGLKVATSTNREGEGMIHFYALGLPCSIRVIQSMEENWQTASVHRTLIDTVNSAITMPKVFAT